MTCYLRMHEVVVGVEPSWSEPDWDAAVATWETATSLADRDQALVASGVAAFDVYDLTATPLDRFAGLLLSGRVDQEFCHRHRDVLRAYLDGGGTVVFSGQLSRPWLPGAAPFALAGDDDGGGGDTRSPLALADHPVLAGVDEVSTGGTLLVTSLDPLSHYGGTFLPAAGRFLDRFLPWAVNALTRRAHSV